MKRIAAILVGLILFLSTTVVHADVILEPTNAFFVAHRDECEHTAYRVYVAEGEATLYTAPYGMKTRTAEPGGQFGVEWIYMHDDGSVWGYCEMWDGWIDLGTMKLRYDDLLFTAEHSDEIRSGDSALFSDYFSGDEAAVYLYPNGPYLYMKNGFSEGWGGPERIYTDTEGLTWGYVGYLYGRVNAWICLDDATNENLGIPEAPLIDSNYTPASGKGYVVTSIFWVAGTVILVSATAAVLLIVLLRKKKKKA